MASSSSAVRRRGRRSRKERSPDPPRRAAACEIDKLEAELAAEVDQRGGVDAVVPRQHPRAGDTPAAAESLHATTTSQVASAGSSPDSTSITSTRGAIRRIIATPFRRGVWQGYGTPTRVPGGNAAISATTSMNSGDGSRLTTGTSLTSARTSSAWCAVVTTASMPPAPADARDRDRRALDPLDPLAEGGPQLRHERLRLGLPALHEQQATGPTAARCAARAKAPAANSSARCPGSRPRRTHGRGSPRARRRRARQRVGDDRADLAARDHPAFVLQPRVDGADGVRVDAQRRRHLADRRQALTGLVLAGRDRVPELPEELRAERYGKV